MRRSPSRLTTIPLLLATLAACGREASPAPHARQPSAYAGDVQPWDTLAPESIYGATAVANLAVQPVELDLVGIPPQWEGMRIAVLSDFQLGLWDRNEAVASAAVRRAASSDADLVVLLGDYLGQGDDTDALQRVLAPLRGRHALAVLGDRDVRDDSLAAAIVRTLREAGAEVLRDSAAYVQHGGATAAVAGADPSLALRSADDQAWTLSQLGGPGRPALLLTHLPLLAARTPAGRFPGILAGDTFCGSVEVPGTPRLSWLAREGLPGAAAAGAPQLFRLGRSVLYVTCGLGYGFVATRFGAPPQIGLVTLHAVGVRRPPPAPGRDTAGVDSLLRRYQGTDSPAAGSAGADTTG